jgi:hypothetical protein
MKIFYFCILLIISISTYGQDDPLALLNQLSNLPAVPASSQAVLILDTNQNGKSAWVTLCDKIDGVWTMQAESFPASAGLKGFAANGEKKEGDGNLLIFFLYFFFQSV